MRLRKNQAGFAGVEIILVVVFVVVIGFVVVMAFNANQTANAPVAEQSVVATDVPTAPSINSTSDLTAAESALDQVDLDSTSDSNQLDAELSAF